MGCDRPPSQGWRTFLLNHADGIASIDLFVAPTISFRLLYGLLVLRHDRRRILWIGVTAHPTAEWIARQVSEACGWESAPQYLIRDRDRVYGEAFTRRIRAMGIRDRPTAPRSPLQNGYAERLIGSIRRECLDHVIVVRGSRCGPTLFFFQGRAPASRGLIAVPYVDTDFPFGSRFPPKYDIFAVDLTIRLRFRLK